MNIQTSCINSYKRKKVSLVVTALMLYSTACGNVHSTATPVLVLIEIPTATPGPPTPTPTPALPTETILATLTPFISPDTPTSIPTFTRKEGWVDLISSYYGYAISLPPTAVVTKNPKIDHVQAELPAGMETGEYLERLNRTYPPGLCISISYQSMYLNISVQDSLGGSLAKPCGTTMLRDVNPVLTEEEVFIGQVAYPATQAIVYESDAPGAKSLEEFYFVNMGNGGLVNFGGEWKDQAAYDQYLSDKAVIFEILRSYRSVPKTELFCPEPAPTRLKAGGFAYVSTELPISYLQQSFKDIRNAPGINQELIGSIETGKTVELLEGPVCNNSLQWWKVRVAENGLVGWTPESGN
ncbi:MAG TPA: SH3 domain-containing protein, partial [Anaerolineales bacterium]|nr:SH3 domain-containing protein [Anaerolineales bacterium]